MQRNLNPQSHWYLRRLIVALVLAVVWAPEIHAGKPEYSKPSSRPRRVIIDTDPGVDDALALLLALRSPEIKVEAITVVAGNVPVETGLFNALCIVEVSDSISVPVALGANAPLKRKLVTATEWHGENGLMGLSLPQPKLKPSSESAIELMGQVIKKSPHQVSIVALGPLTNLALAFKADPQLPALVEEVVLMGGSLSGGNVSPAAEFNFYVDPEAARIVFHSGVPLTMVGLDVTRKVILTEEHLKVLEASKDKVSEIAARLARNLVSRYKSMGESFGPAMHDPLAVAAFIDRSLLRLERMHVDIETSGELTAGEALAYRSGSIVSSAPLLDQPVQDSINSKTLAANASVGMEVNAAAFFRMFIGRLKGVSLK